MTTQKPSSSSEAQLDKILEPFAVYLRNHEVGADKVILKKALSELLSRERALGGVEAVEYILAMPHDGDDWYGDDLREYLNQLKKG